MRVRPGTNAVSMSVPMRMPKTEIDHYAEKLLASIAKKQGQSIEEFSGRLKQNRQYSDGEKILFDKIKEFLPKWEAKTGLQCKSWGIRNVCSYWGICRRKGNHIDFNINLAHKPPECLEYIILHELAHIRQQNHGPKFKAILDKYMPGWRETAKILKTRGG